VESVQTVVVAAEDVDQEKRQENQLVDLVALGEVVVDQETVAEVADRVEHLVEQKSVGFDRMEPVED